MSLEGIFAAGSTSVEGSFDLVAEFFKNIVTAIETGSTGSTEK